MPPTLTVPAPDATPSASSAHPLRTWQPWRRTLVGLALPVCVFIAWTLAAEHAWVPAQILPSPATVLQTGLEMVGSGELQEHLLVSLWRVLAGFAFGVGGGLLLGLAMGLSNTVKEYLYPSFRIVMQVPSLGWLPFLMLVLGIGEALKVVLIAKAALVPVAINTYDGLRHSPVHYLEVARVLNLNAWQRLRRVVLPAAFPPIWSGVRYGLTHAWLALVAVELLASSEGLGYLIVYGRQLYQLDVVMVAVVAVGAVGFLLDRTLGWVETRLLRWRPPTF